MESSILSERAKEADRFIRMTGEGHFPFSHPDYPHQAWLTPEKRKATETPTPADSNPFAKGLAGGLRLWEQTAAPVPWTEFRAVSPQRVPAFRKTNGTWLEKTVPAFYRVGMPQGGVVLRRPQSPAVFDLMTDRRGWALLEAAHALAHRADVRQRFKPQGYGLYGSLTVNWVARLAAALTYDLPVDVSGDPPPSTPEEALRSNDGFHRYGISLCDSNCFHTPFIRVPCLGRNAPVPDRDICFLAVGVYIEPHPKGFADGTGKWLEVNRWSCSPTMVSFAGWELADVVLRQQPSVSGFGRALPEFVIAAPALQPYDALPAYIEAAKAARGEAVADNVRYWKVDDWLASPACRELVDTSPPLPCRDCLRLNMRAEGAPGRPQCLPPKEKPDKKSKYLTREEREWLDWDARIDQVFDLVEKAVIYSEARLWGATEAKRKRRSRRKAANFRARALEKTETLLRRAQAAFRGGRPSAARKLLEEARALQEKTRNAILTPDEEGQEEAEETRVEGPHPPSADAPLDGARPQ